MAYDNLSDLNRQRRKEYYKDETEEAFLLNINKILKAEEERKYQDLKEIHPTIFVFGLPRSGTTFMTQLIANSFDLGYINNFTARFWLAPVTGIRLSDNILGREHSLSFQSDYAATKDPGDIHEFGYFWRHWLKKDNIRDILHSEEIEKDIHWDALRRVILNIHDALGRGWICKNIFGAYHLERFAALLDKLLIVYIERDPVDNAISIMDARKRFYDDLTLWWSTIPYEYDKLKVLTAEEQVAGQVYYLRKYYEQQLSKLDRDRYIKVDYREATASPQHFTNLVRKRYKEKFGIELKEKAAQGFAFKTRSYENRKYEKELFGNLLQKFAREDT